MHPTTLSAAEAVTAIEKLARIGRVRERLNHMRPVLIQSVWQHISLTLSQCSVGYALRGRD